MRVRRAGIVGLVAVATIALGIPSVGAEPGDLDATFGTCGVKTRSVPTDSSVHTTLAQSDGKILQVGASGAAISVTRLVPSGAGIDGSYGTNGTARLALPRLRRVVGAAIGPNNTLVVVGARNAAGEMDLVRFTASGAPDPTFGTDGIVRSSRLAPWGVLVQADNRIVVWRGPHPPRMERYNADGTRDGSWAPPLPEEDGFVGAAIQAANGDLLVAFQQVPDTHVFRFHPDGTPDSTFSASFEFPSGSPDVLAVYEPGQIVELADGKLRVVGSGLLGQAGTILEQFIAAVQLDTTGAIDTSYGDAGIARTNVPKIALQLHARIDVQGRLVFAARLGNDPLDSPLLLGRFNAAGFPDPGFGTGGSVMLGIGAERVSGLIIRGKWILVSAFVDVGGESPALLRFRNDHTKLGAGYWLDSDGGLMPIRLGFDPPPPCVQDGPSLSGLARAATTVTNRGGYVLDGFGGLHRFSAGARKAPAEPKGGPYWPGWDIARGVAALPNGKGGYVLDGFGGIHRYRTGSNPLPPALVGTPYWPGWDIARGIALLPDGTGGYVLDGVGGIHPFAVGANPMPPSTTGLLPPVRDWFLGIAILTDGSGGYVTVPGGGLTTFAIGSHAQPEPPCPCGLRPRPGQIPILRNVAFIAPRVGFG